MRDEVDRVLPWHESEWRSLLQRMQAGRLHHALLVSGLPGIGKRSFAAAALRALLCSSPGPAACGECRACQLVAAGTHPDALCIVPDEPGKQIRIAQVREELIDFVMRTASIGARKVVVIEPAEAMNTATANCLLKSLEEPSAGTHLLLVSDAPVRLLPTIRARCEHLRLRAPAPAEAIEWLASRCAEPGSAPDLLGAASGCPLRALAMDNEGGLEGFSRVAAVLARALEPAVWIPSVASALDTMDLRTVLSWMQVFLCDMGRWLADPASIRIARARPIYEAIARHVDAAHAARSLLEVTAAMREAASTANPNRQLSIESVLTGWGRLVR